MHVRGYYSGREIVRWGIIGCGNVTEVKSGPGFQRADRSSLVAVMRRNGALAADFARRHRVPRSYDDAHALITDPEVDAVYIATPPDSHARYALMVAEHRKPAYVEKPMARHLPECDRMVDAFATAGLPLFIAYYRRRLPRFLLVEELIKTGAIGEVTGINYRQVAPFHRKEAAWRVDAEAAGGGHFLDLGSHALDLLDYLFGPLTDISGTAANLASGYLVEDVVTLGFRAAGGIPGAATWNFAGAIPCDMMTISGTKGELAFSIFGNEGVRFESAAGVKVFDRPNPAHVQQPLIQSVVDDLLGRGECPSTGETARRTSWIMDVALDAYYGGRSDSFWDRSEHWPGRSMQSGERKDLDSPSRKPESRPV